MKIVVIGTGYVGLVTGACLAAGGHVVTCVDINQQKIDMLQKGHSPIWEPGLDELLTCEIKQERLFFTASLESALQDADALFIAVGTPQSAEGSADLSYLLDAAESIGAYLQKTCLVIIKSTVPVGTGKIVSQTINNRLKKRDKNFSVPVCSNPEFLKEGTAIEDFKNGERIIIGVSNSEEEAKLREIYAPFNRRTDKIIVMDVVSAELTKYAANAMLASRISFMNEIAGIAEATEADIDAVRIGIGADSRIGDKFLYPGAGYGGSCFPKDVKALRNTAQINGRESSILDAIDRVNDSQKQLLFRKLKNLLPYEEKQKIAVWGLAFKPMTDDVREAPSLTLIKHLLEAGYEVAAYDPIATDSFIRELGSDADRVNFCEKVDEPLYRADALIICTEWEEFRVFNSKMLKDQMRGNLIIDGRNLYSPSQPANEGFIYASVGRVTTYPSKLNDKLVSS